MKWSEPLIGTCLGAFQGPHSDSACDTVAEQLRDAGQFVCFLPSWNQGLLLTLMLKLARDRLNSQKSYNMWSFSQRLQFFVRCLNTLKTPERSPGITPTKSYVTLVDQRPLAGVPDWLMPNLSSLSCKTSSLKLTLQSFPTPEMASWPHHLTHKQNSVYINFLFVEKQFDEKWGNILNLRGLGKFIYIEVHVCVDFLFLEVVEKKAWWQRVRWEKDITTGKFE